jgi:endoglucanase
MMRFIPTTVAIVALAAAGCGDSGGASPASGTPASSQPSGAMRDLTSLQLAREMSPGINLGNTLEAIPGETSWNPVRTTQVVMDGFKAAGFRSVRIPVAWSQYVDANDDISPAWMARVTEVVGYARRAGLYAIINIHWDGGWMNHPTYDRQAAINEKLARFWTQIANNFKDHDDYLLFAGTNEVGQENNWQAPTTEYAAVQNGFNQTFVNAVRATGGNNARRHLVVQGYLTNIGYTVDFARMPTDTVANRLFVEVHYYDPYDFTLNGDSPIWQWGSIATDPAAVEPWADEPWADAQFQRMKVAFVDRGVPVLLGEYAAGLKPRYPEMNRYRKYWIQYVTRSIFQHGLVPVYWDTGGLLDRATGAVKEPDVVSLIVDSAK